MPRPRKGARLWLRKDIDQWIILDGTKQVRTGCSTIEIDAANRKLASYIDAHYSPSRTERQIASISIADVISIYIDDKKPNREVLLLFQKLISYWGDKHLADISGSSIRVYVNQTTGARKKLQYLAAAVNHHHKEGYHREVIKIPLPPKGRPRERWLTRNEVAKLVWTCWRTEKMKHLARFTLMAYYTASRPGAVLSASWVNEPGRSYIDLDNRIFYRLKAGATETKKRQPPVPLTPNLAAHIRRWTRTNKAFVVEYDAKPVGTIKTGFSSAVALSNLPGRISPHTLRHTAVTHMMQRGVPDWEAAGFAGMTVEMVRNVYGHHSPEHMKNARKALNG